MKTLLEKLYSKVERDPLTGCFNWIAAKCNDGYGQICIGNKKIRRAHRVSYQLHYGVDPLGLCVLHKCDNPSCVNPQHLFLGTHTDNMRDMLVKGRNAHKNKTHCKHGHEYTEDNMYKYGNARHCKTCVKLREKSRVRTR